MKLSVIIPFYNRKRYIKECLKSVLASSLKSMEVICINDGSTDDTLEVLERIAKKSKRCRVISIPHKGPYEARWAGLRIARGEYVHFMDSDDIIEPGAYKTCYELCKKNNLDYLVFQAKPFTGEKHTDKEEARKVAFERHYALDKTCCGKVMSGEDLMRKLCEAKSFFVGFPMRFIRRELMPIEEKLTCTAFWHADNFYSVYWLLRAKRAMAIPRKFYNRRVHSNSITLCKETEALHVKSIFLVILAFCRAYEGEGAKNILANGYMMRQIRGVVRRRGRLKDSELLRLANEVFKEENPVMKSFVNMAFMPLLFKAAKIL